MNYGEQITHLNSTVKCTLAPSRIHGVGVFALRDIEHGEDLCVGLGQRTGRWYDIPGACFDQLYPGIRKLILDRWANAGEPGRPFKSPNDDANLMSFMNHSDEPNSAFGRALRFIFKGEEITEDYNNLGAPLSALSSAHYGVFLKP